MATPVPLVDLAANTYIVARVLPVVLITPQAVPVSMEAVGSVGENTGPTTGQISPRY